MRSRLAAVLLACGLLVGCGGQTREQVVAERGAEVMPFSLDATTHVFDAGATGGTQRVVADDPRDGEQIRLIREHLRAEAAAFRRGDFGDPAAIHGREMPGLAQLEAGYERIAVRYGDLPDGAKLVYRSADPALVAALHDWFAAQLGDHGAHAERG